MFEALTLIVALICAITLARDLGITFLPRKRVAASLLSRQRRG